MLDPQAKALLDAMPPMPDFDGIPVDVLRQGMAAQNALAPGQEPEPVARVLDRSIPGADGDVPVRIYTPSGDGPFPVLVYFHGGGFVLCDLDTHDGTCRSLANGAGAVVVSVDYRLAPEHAWPAAPEDCYAATRWVAENRKRENSDFVLHVGDVIQSGQQCRFGCDEETARSANAEWDRFLEGWAAIEQAGIPYAIVPGNHDNVDRRDLRILSLCAQGRPRARAARHDPDCRESDLDASGAVGLEDLALLVEPCGPRCARR